MSGCEWRPLPSCYATILPIVHSNISISLFWFFSFRAAAFLLASIRRCLAASVPFDEGTLLLLFTRGFLFSVLLTTVFGFGRTNSQLLAFISSSFVNRLWMSSICRQTMSQKPAKSPSNVTNSPSFCSMYPVLSLCLKRNRYSIWVFNSAYNKNKIAYEIFDA